MYAANNYSLPTFSRRVLQNTRSILQETLMVPDSVSAEFERVLRSLLEFEFVLAMANMLPKREG